MSSPVKTLGWYDDKDHLMKMDSKLVVLGFMAPWSDPCKFMKPKLDSLAKEMKEKADFYTLDIDEFKVWAGKLRVEVLPTFLLVHKWRVKRRVVGIDKDDLKNAIIDVHRNSIGIIPS